MVEPWRAVTVVRLTRSGSTSMLFRKFGKLLLGKATPFQITAAAMIGGAIGFMPGLHALGMLFLLLVVLIILNANLFVAALVGIVAKALSWALLPLTYQVGQALLDGPVQGVFRTLINAPGTALLGLEYYIITGGVVMGCIVGLLCGWLLVRGLRLFRMRMAKLEEGSERYKQFMAKWWTGPLMFLLFGAKPSKKKTFQDLLKRRYGMPIRPLGIVLSVLTIAAFALLAGFTTEPIVTAALQRALERANGATVDLGSAELDLENSRLVIHDLAMADPNKLENDLLRAELVEANIGGLELLRKRLVLDLVVVSRAQHDVKRTFPGRHVGPPPEPRDPIEFPDMKDIEEYWRTAKEWKERLAQVREWLDVLSGPSDDEDSQERRLRDLGYARMRAEHLIEGRPTFLIRELQVRVVETDHLPEGETFDVVAQNLSSHPRLQEKPPHVEIRSSRETIGAVIDLASVVDADAVSEASFNLRGWPVDSIASQWGDDAPLAGGTLQADSRIAFTGGVNGAIDSLLNITLRDSTITIPEVGSHKVEEFALPLSVRGMLDSPQIGISGEALATALKKAGAAELANRLQKELDKELGDITGDLPIKIPDEINKKAGDVIKDLFGDD